MADNRAGTVSFHLARPDPDFLYKLTLTYADVLTASTPDSQARNPLPATGPYLISRYIPGDELRLTRNPRFREWSAAAQPAGYPDVSCYGSTSAEPRSRSVAVGEADFMANLGQSRAATPPTSCISSRPGSRESAMETSFMFLNVRAAPFNDIRVRQALNLALDRGRIVTPRRPGRSPAHLSILPPGIPATAATAPTRATRPRRAVAGTEPAPCQSTG